MSAGKSSEACCAAGSVCTCGAECKCAPGAPACPACADFMDQKQKDDYAARAAKLGFVSREAINARCLQEGTVFIDMRSEAEVAEQRLPGPFTLNIPLDKDDPLTDYTKVTDAHALCFAEKRDTPILVFCRSGARAAFAKKALEEVLCYSDVINGGGLKDLIKSGGGVFENELPPM